MGIEAFLTKPVRHSSLLDCLSTLIGGKGSATVVPVAPPETPTGLHPPGAHLLVVEDNLVNQRVAALTLESLGYCVDLAANGAEALDAIARVHYAAILMDCQMPVMDGYQATAEIRRRERGRRTPIIAMTAGVGREDEVRCLAAGMDAYVPKPVRPAELASVLRRWLRDPDRAAPTEEMSES